MRVVLVRDSDGLFMEWKHVDMLADVASAAVDFSRVISHHSASQCSPSFCFCK